MISICFHRLNVWYFCSVCVQVSKFFSSVLALWYKAESFFQVVILNNLESDILYVFNYLQICERRVAECWFYVLQILGLSALCYYGILLSNFSFSWTEFSWIHLLWKAIGEWREKPTALMGSFNVFSKIQILLYAYEAVSIFL